MTQLVTNEPKALVAWEAPEGGWISDGNEDIDPAFPIISIAQPMTQAKGNMPGWFYHSDTEEFTSDFDCVPLVKRNTRAMFVTGDDKPICRSDDALEPAKNQRLWQMEPGDRIRVGDRDFGVPRAPRECDDCPFSQWIGDKAPPCGNAYAIIAARNGDVDDLVQLRLKGTSIKPYKDWIRKKLAPHREPMYFYQLHLTTEEKVEPGRKWYQLQINAFKLNQEDAVMYDRVIRAHRARIEHAVTEAGGEIESWEDDSEPFE